MNKGMFFRRKEGRLYCVWLNSLGKERCRVVGDASMSNDDGCIRVGELGLDKLITKPDAIKATFGEVLDHYLAQGKTKSGRPKAESTKEVEERNARLYLRPQWAKRIAKDSRLRFKNGSMPSVWKTETRSRVSCQPSTDTGKSTA